MNPSARKDNIIKLLEDIVNQTKYISHHHPGKDLSLDIDLIKDDLRTLYRYFEDLKNMANEQEYIPSQVASSQNEAQTMQGKNEAEPPAIRETDENDAITGDANMQAPTVAEQAEIPKEDTAEPTHVKEEKIIEAAYDEQAETPATQPPGTDQEPEEDQTETIAEKDGNQTQTPNNNGKKSVIDLLSTYSQKTIGDQYAEADNSLNKRISGNQHDNSIGAKMQLKPIDNIKEVIGLNEKFLFINELFDGNIQEYHDAIARLNDMENMQQAFDYLNELSAKYSWDAERSTATINKLATYVQRRYM